MITEAVIVAAAMFFAGMGVYALAAPVRMIAPLQISVLTPTARSEIRAVYGGFGLAIATVLAVALIDPGVRIGILITVGAALAGMASGRVLSALDGRTSFYPNWFYCLVESAAATALFAVA